MNTAAAPSLLRIVVAVLSLLSLAGCETEGKLNAGKTPAGAPASAQRLDPQMGPREIYSFVMTAKSAAERDAAEQSVIGLWTPAQGWEGTVDTVTKEKGGYAIRMHFAVATIVGGGVWVVALVPGDEPNVSRRDVVEVEGRIDEVVFSKDSGARLVLDGVKVLTARRGN